MNTHTMQIHVTGRHVTVTEAIKEYARRKLEAIGIDFPRVIDAHVILDVEKYRHRCEIILACANHIHIEANEESDNMYASIDLCVDKLARQMRKYKTKIQRHHRHRKQDVVHLEEHVLTADGLDVHEDAQPKVIHKETFAVKPMFPDEAVLQLELSPRQFLVFLNPQTERVNVLYRRKTGNFGLIEAAMPR
ncbi:MAG: ribosome-associated translation inhibitor RaiA [Verrucomicrobia bacterium]|nr:ribosome-associated translation inhibitor RaiA [Verrucomicrobiota bacterium]